MDIPRRRVAAAPRAPREHSAEAGRGATWIVRDGFGSAPSRSGRRRGDQTKPPQARLGFAGCRALAPQTGGGSRGAARRGNCFLVSKDGRFVLKQEDAACLDRLERGVAAAYAAAAADRASLLPRLLGAYTVTPADGPATHWLVMANTFGARPGGAVRVRRCYDLKGSTAGRKTRPKLGTLKDLDARDDAAALACFNGDDARETVRRLAVDSEALMELGLLDYSLLVGVCDAKVNPGPLAPLRTIAGWPRRRVAAWAFKRRAAARGVRALASKRDRKTFLVVGLIDVLQPWTLAKRLEFACRGAIRGWRAISAVPPRFYRRRFLKFCEELLVGDAAGAAMRNA